MWNELRPQEIRIGNLGPPPILGRMKEDCYLSAHINRLIESSCCVQKPALAHSHSDVLL
jgi:hypothetical protein